jgi:hypothetical protein
MLLLCEEDKGKVSRFFPKEVGQRRQARFVQHYADAAPVL